MNSKTIRALDWPYSEVAKRIGITQPKVSDVVRGDCSNLSKRKLSDRLTMLGCAMQINARPAE